MTFAAPANTPRRRCPLLAVLALCSATCMAAPALTVQELAPGVFVHVGAHAMATPQNGGAIANVAFVVGARCIAVIDTGGSYEEGASLRAAVRTHSRLPVCYVINTHVHPDHVYGNAAFADDHPHFVGHHKLAAAMRARQAYYVQYLERTLGPALAGPSTQVLPDTAVAVRQTLDLGGRTLVLRAWPTAHTDNDLSVLDEQSGTLFLGDLLFTERIPVIDGSVRGWLATMENLRAMRASHVVPGHGAPTTDWPAALAPQERYLAAVRDGVRQALRDRRSIGQASTEVALSERGNWKLFDAYHAHNVTTTFAELEWED